MLFVIRFLLVLSVLLVFAGAGFIWTYRWSKYNYSAKRRLYLGCGAIWMVTGWGILNIGNSGSELVAIVVAISGLIMIGIGIGCFTLGAIKGTRNRKLQSILSDIPYEETSIVEDVYMLYVGIKNSFLSK